MMMGKKKRALRMKTTFSFSISTQNTMWTLTVNLEANPLNNAFVSFFLQSYKFHN